MATTKKKPTVTVTETRTKQGKVTTREASDEGPDLHENIQRLAQKGRAAGIHLVVATQRASVQVIGGDVKVNFPIKVVFRMDKATSSIVMLDEPGAEHLLGKGDMLFASDQGIERLQGYNA